MEGVAAAQRYSAREETGGIIGKMDRNREEGGRLERDIFRIMTTFVQRAESGNKTPNQNAFLQTLKGARSQLSENIAKGRVLEAAHDELFTLIKDTDNYLDDITRHMNEIVMNFSGTEKVKRFLTGRIATLRIERQSYARKGLEAINELYGSHFRCRLRDRYITVIDGPVPEIYKTSHAIRSASEKVLKNKEAFLDAIKEAKDTPSPMQSEKERMLSLQSLLDDEEAAQKAAAPKQRKSKKKNSGGGAKKTTSAEVFCPLPGAAAAPAAVVKKLTDSQIVIRVFNNHSTAPSVYLHRRVRLWDAADFGAKKLTHSNYGRLSKAERMEQIIKHGGLDLHLLLTHPKLEKRYVWNSPRGPMVWCTIYRKDGKPEMTGKIHFGVEEQDDGRKLVYHRGFTQARPSSLVDFVKINAPDAFEEDEAAEAGTEVVHVGKSAVSLNGDNLIIKHRQHAYIDRIEVHPLAR